MQPHQGRETHPDGDARWQRLVALQDDAAREGLALPETVSRIDGKRRANSPKAVRFAEALAFDDGWAGISNAKRRSRRDLAA